MNWISKSLILLLCGFMGLQAHAQSTEVKQLLLNVEKLSQLKNILADMKKGYQVVSQGYTAVRNIAQGNFSLHELFLNGLWLVSPEVRKYHKLADIIRDQTAIVSEYRGALKRFSASGAFSVSELEYLSKVYGELFRASLDNLDQLAMVVTANKLRMSDEERLEAIDRIHADTSDKLDFLRSFNGEASLLQLQRKQESAAVGNLGQYFKKH